MPNTKGKKIWECFKCHKKDRQKNLKKLNEGLCCSHCQKELRKNHREFLKRNILHIRKREDLMKEWQKKREQRQLIPKIKGSKDTSQIKIINPYKGIWLTSIEKYIIYKKYSSMGWDVNLIKKRYEEIKNQFESMIEKWREEKKTDEDINKKFKEEFAKLIMENQNGTS